MSSADFHDYVINDILADIGSITSRRMFGGYGIYFNGIIFGLIVEDELYFKVGEKNLQDYKDLGSRPFTYEGKNHKQIIMPYWLVPAEILEDKKRLFEWIAQSASFSKKSK